jgi:hypothetical protein
MLPISLAWLLSVNVEERVVTSNFSIIVLARDDIVVNTLNDLLHRLERRSKSFQRVQLLPSATVMEIGPFDANLSLRAGRFTRLVRRGLIAAGRWLIEIYGKIG